MNEGICVLRNGSYRCECQGGWEGPHCKNRECGISSNVGAGVVFSVLLFPRSVPKEALGHRWKESVIGSFIHETFSGCPYIPGAMLGERNRAGNKTRRLSALLRVLV